MPAPHCPQPLFHSLQCLLLIALSADTHACEKWKEKPEAQHGLSDIWIQTQNTRL